MTSDICGDELSFVAERRLSLAQSLKAGITRHPQSLTSRQRRLKSSIVATRRKSKKHFPIPALKDRAKLIPPLRVENHSLGFHFQLNADEKLKVITNCDHLGQFSFAFTKKGMDNEDWYNDFRIINVPIRGLSKNEFVYVLKSEFIKLSEVEKKKLRPIATSMKKKT